MGPWVLGARLADVYEVCGAVGRECQVQLAFGSSTKQTKDWVSPGPAEKVCLRGFYVCLLLYIIVFFKCFFFALLKGFKGPVLMVLVHCFCVRCGGVAGLVLLGVLYAGTATCYDTSKR